MELVFFMALPLIGLGLLALFGTALGGLIALLASAIRLAGWAALVGAMFLAIVYVPIRALDAFLTWCIGV